VIAHKGRIGLALATCALSALANAPARTSAAEPQLRVAPAIHSSQSSSQSPQVRLVQYPVNYGSGWGWSGGYSGYGGYAPYGGNGWGGYGGPGGYVSYPVYSSPVPYSGVPVYSAYPIYSGYPVYSPSVPNYWTGYPYPIYSAGYPGSYGYTYGPPVTVGFW
jgi:hypothetical protein